MNKTPTLQEMWAAKEAAEAMAEAAGAAAKAHAAMLKETYEAMLEGPPADGKLKAYLYAFVLRMRGYLTIVNAHAPTAKELEEVGGFLEEERHPNKHVALEKARPRFPYVRIDIKLIARLRAERGIEGTRGPRPKIKFES